jgi:hypothetical protein
VYTLSKEGKRIHEKITSLKWKVLANTKKKRV